MALSSTDRQRRFLARLKERAAAAAVSDGPDVDAVREIAALKAELAQAKAQITEMHLDYAAERQAFRDEAKRRTRTAQPKTAKPPLPPDEQRDREIASLKKRLAEARGERNHLRDWVRKGELPERAGMSFSTHKTIMKPLHPDYRKHLTRAELDEALDAACKAFTAWSDSLKPRR